MYKHVAATERERERDNQSIFIPASSRRTNSSRLSLSVPDVPPDIHRLTIYATLFILVQSQYFLRKCVSANLT